MKKLWRGIFNYFGQSITLYTHSTSKEKAFLNFCTQLAKWAEVGKGTIMKKFDGSIDNYFIEEVEK